MRNALSPCFATIDPYMVPNLHLANLAWRDCGSANTGEPIMWQVHPTSSIPEPEFAGTSAACVFPRYSTRLFKETLAVIGLALFIMAFVTLLTLATPYSFSNSPAFTACSTLDHMVSLQTACLH